MDTRAQIITAVGLGLACFLLTLWGCSERSELKGAKHLSDSLSQDLKDSEAKYAAAEDALQVTQKKMDTAVSELEEKKKAAAQLDTQAKDLKSRLKTTEDLLAAERAKIKAPPAQITQDAAHTKPIEKAAGQDVIKTPEPASKTTDVEKNNPNVPNNTPKQPEASAGKGALDDAAANLKKAQDLSLSLDKRNRELEKLNQDLSQQNKAGATAYDKLQADFNTMKGANDRQTQDIKRLNDEITQLRKDLQNARSGKK